MLMFHSLQLNFLLKIALHAIKSKVPSEYLIFKRHVFSKASELIRDTIVIRNNSLGQDLKK